MVAMFAEQTFDDRGFYLWYAEWIQSTQAQMASKYTAT